MSFFVSPKTKALLLFSPLFSKKKKKNATLFVHTMMNLMIILTQQIHERASPRVERLREREILSISLQKKKKIRARAACVNSSS